jgi:hypothetical protein
MPNSNGDGLQRRRAVNANNQPQTDAGRLEAATEQAIAACGGNMQDAAKALIVACEPTECFNPYAIVVRAKALRK